MKKTVTVLLVITACAAVITVHAKNNKGIHNISPTAVYIEGESCVINVNNRTTEAIERDLEGCSLFHDILTK